MKRKIEKLQDFISYGIWRNIPSKGHKQKRRRRYNILKSIIITVRGFVDHRISQKASALTYYSALSIIPILALIYGIAKGFGFEATLQNELITAFPGNKASIKEIFVIVGSYMEYAKSGVIIGIGIVFLLWSGLSLISNIDTAFNDLWQIKKGRPYYQQIIAYLVLIVVAPILIILSSGISIFFSTELPVFLHIDISSSLSIFSGYILPLLMVSIIFFLLYLMIPNTKVHLTNALIPALVTGVIFQLFQLLYINGQIWASKYNAIFGGFAAIPLLMLWLQVSWLIILLGAQLSFAMENIKNYSYELDVDTVSERYRKFLTLSIVSLICKRFIDGRHPYTASELSDSFNIPIRLTREILFKLTEVGILIEIPDQNDSTSLYQPAIDTNNLTVALLFERLERYGSEKFDIDKAGFQKPWMMTIKLSESLREAGKDILVKDL